jgi:hypothetical protein
MSHYSCPTCSGSTTVVETRKSKKGLRRRRRCDHNHRFTTFELPHDTGKRAINLIKWLTAKLDPEIAGYALSEIRFIMAGQPPEQDDTDATTSPLCSSGSPDREHPYPEAATTSPEGQGTLWPASDLHQGGASSPPSQVTIPSTLSTAEARCLHREARRAPGNSQGNS